MAVLYLLAFVGASAGSTAGGIKMSRLIIASKAIAHSFVQILRPNSISHITFDGSEVPKDVVRNALIVIMLFIIILNCLLFFVFWPHETISREGILAEYFILLYNIYISST